MNIVSNYKLKSLIKVEGIDIVNVIADIIEHEGINDIDIVELYSDFYIWHEREALINGVHILTETYEAELDIIDQDTMTCGMIFSGYGCLLTCEFCIGKDFPGIITEKSYSVDVNTISIKTLKKYAKTLGLTLPKPKYKLTEEGPTLYSYKDNQLIEGIDLYGKSDSILANLYKKDGSIDIINVDVNDILKIEKQEKANKHG